MYVYSSVLGFVNPVSFFNLIAFYFTSFLFDSSVLRSLVFLNLLDILICLYFY